jgi:hypothetical protein
MYILVLQMMFTVMDYTNYLKVLTSRCECWTCYQPDTWIINILTMNPIFLKSIFDVNCILKFVLVFPYPYSNCNTATGLSHTKYSFWIYFKFCQAAWLSGDTVAFCSRSTGLESRICGGVFLQWGVIPLYIQTVCFCISVSVVHFISCVVFEGDLFTFCWPPVRRDPLIESMLL